MKKSTLGKICAVTMLMVSLNVDSYAGNKDRAGQMGATELNINPWAASSALFYSNSATVYGIEAMKLNPAGLVKQKGLEIGVSYNMYMSGTDINFVNGAFGIDLNDESKLGINMMAFNFGDVNLATVESPEQDVTFAPSFFNLGLTYAREFSENVSTGFQATLLSENIGDARATGVSIDAGIQYQGGNNNNTHFGVVLRNVGPTFSFSGDGFNQQSTDVNGNPITQKMPTEDINLPTQLIISGSYDIYLGMDRDAEINRDSAKHILTPMFSFTSNAFYSDHIALGMEYGLNQKFFMRAAYRYESKIFSSADAQTLFSGLSAGLGLKFNLNKEDQTQPLNFDYAYRMTRFSGGVHSVSLKYTIN